MCSACCDLPLDILCVELVGCCSNVVGWWPLSVLVGILGGSLVKADLTCYLCLALGNQFEDTGDPPFVAASAVLGCVQEGPSWAPRVVFTTTGPISGSANVARHPWILIFLPPPSSWLLLSVMGKVQCVKEPQVESRDYGSRISPKEEERDRLHGRWWVCSPTPEPHIWVCPDFFPELGTLESMVVRQVGDQKLGSQKPGCCLYQISYEEPAPMSFKGK